jgi:radical SAM enzyme (TIGR01210 family)
MTAPFELYPQDARGRDRWVLERRPPRNALDPWKPYGFFVEDEFSHGAKVVKVATVLLTNRECPWRCVMCDLWRNTLTETVPVGAIPAQIKHALDRLPPAEQIKLYNSGSFFDPGAIPRADYPAIAGVVKNFSRVIVECHPALVGESCGRFQDLLGKPLEVAMGLETANPQALERLNKRMTLDQFAGAAARLKKEGVALRVFVLVAPPFIAGEESDEWVRRSVDFAFDCGATAVSLIATRAGNGAMEMLVAQGLHGPPVLSTLESAAEYAVTRGRGRSFADLWDVERIAACASCAAPRIARLRRMNLTQTVPPPIHCGACGA